MDHIARIQNEKSGQPQDDHDQGNYKKQISHSLCFNTDRYVSILSKGQDFHAAEYYITLAISCIIHRSFFTVDLNFLIS
jgi:hypothetical protein